MKEQFHPVRDNEECERIIQGTYQGVLAMTVGDEPYAVPLNHAYREGRFYFHCASSGQKLDAIRQNPSVAYVIKRYYGDSAELAKSMKCHGHWESVIAYGRARVVSEKREPSGRSASSWPTTARRTTSTERRPHEDERHRHRRRPHVRPTRVRRVQDGLLDLGAGGVGAPEPFARRSTRSGKGV